MSNGSIEADGEGSRVLPSLDVVIVAFNTRDYLGQCLHSLARVVVTDRVRLDCVAIVDNASTDGGLEELPFLDLPIEVERNPVNEGFAAAVNRGARRGSAPYILLLNPDVELHPGSLRRPLEVMDSPQGSDIAVCGVRILGADGTVTRKCGYKLIQYMACGLPTIASPIGVNREIVAEGKTGFLVEGKEQWRDALINLLGNSELRAHLGDAGRTRVQNHYSLDVQAPRLTALLRRAAGRPLQHPG